MRFLESIYVRVRTLNLKRALASKVDVSLRKSTSQQKNNNNTYNNKNYYILNETTYILYMYICYWFKICMCVE